MSDKTIKGLLIVLAVLIAIYGVFRFFESKNLKPKNPEGYNFSNLKEKSIDKISVNNTKDEYELIKKNNKWQIDGKDVDSSNMSQLWTLLQDTKVSSFVTDNKNEFSLFQVDANGNYVTFYHKGKKVASFVFGKQGSDYINGYVRKPKSNKVYLISGHIGSFFDRTRKDWYPTEKTSK